MKRITAILLVLAFTPLLATPSASALLGAGDVVFDPQAFVRQVISFALQANQYATQMKQFSSQIQQLENEYAHLRNLGFKADLSNLSQMRNTMNSAMGLSNDFSKMQGQFQKLYPNFATYNGQSGGNYAQQSAQWSLNNQQNAMDTLTVATKLQDSINQDQSTLQYLSGRSDSASGTKDLLQTMNQLLILQTKQLMQLQQLITTSAKADAAFLAQSASNNEASRAASDNIYRDWTSKGSRTPAPAPGHALE